MKRLLWIALAVVIAAGIGAPYLNADFILPRIERALERGLGRRVEIARGVNFNLFTGPGFTLNDVTIYEDPRAGIEPFAHVWTLEARVRLLSLFSRKLEFSSLRLGEQTDINLVKTEAGPWNFQYLLGSAPALAGSMPAIRMRGGRVNFKFGDTKSVFYLSDADFDVSPSDDGSVELRLSGAPSRTDRAAQNFGHFFLRGTWNRQRLDMRVELEPSVLEEVARLFDQRGFGLHGIIALDAQISGAPSNLEVAGYLQIDDLHRGDLPKRGGAWRVDYKGSLDLRGDRLELQSTAEGPNPPLALRFRAWDFLSAPQWDAAADLKRIPLSMAMEAARHVGAAFSDKLAAEGSVSGEVSYSAPDGLAGHVELQDATLTLPDAQPLHAANAEVAIDGDTMTLATSTVRVGDNEEAEVEGSFNPAQGLDLRIATRGLSVADLRSFGLSAIPLLEQTPLGTWRGWARYQWTPGSVGEWSGEYDLQNAHIAIEGLADPLRIQSASVVSSGARVSVSRLRAKIGAIALTGDYRWEPASVRPHKFSIAIPQADAAELERILMPTLVRERGFLARTLRLGPAPVPEWLKQRRADGTISIGALTIGGLEASIDSARVLWDGTLLRLARVNASIDDASAAGDLALDLTGRAPHYRFDGKIGNVAYKGGSLDFEGTLEADGADAEFLASARAEGSLRGRSIAFAPDADFRSVAGCFDLLPGMRWKLSCLDVVEGAQTLSGSGATQSDGRMVLDLTSSGRQIRYTSAASLAPPQP